MARLPFPLWMGRDTRKEIDRLERRIAELREQEERERLNVRLREGGDRPAPMPGVATDVPSVPIEVQLAVEPDPKTKTSSPPAARKRPARRKRRPNAKKAKRVEQAVVASVVLFFGGCMALVATQGKKDDKATADTPKPKASGSVAGKEEGEASPPDEENLAPDPSGVCEMLVSAGVAKSCNPSEAAGRGERVAVFELTGSKGGRGRVRTFDSSARCQRAGGPGGGHWYARCDARTAIVIPSHVDAEGTLAARRVAARL